jgi:ribosomal protein S18 acetylase RimI-like enzyme
MSDVRPATGDDIGELVRLRAILFGELGSSWGPPPNGADWRELAVDRFASMLAGNDACVLVIPDGAGRGLVACGIGVLDPRLPSPYNPSGTVGHVFGVVTDPAHRKQGHARAIMRGLVAWFDEHGIGRIDLNASQDGLALYRELGFREHPDPTMSRNHG